MQIPKQIKEAIERNSLVIFAGSGLSLKFKFPNWNRLVVDIIDLIDEPKYQGFLPILENDLLSPIEVLDKIEKEHAQIHKYIKDKFQVSSNDLNLHKKLLDLSGKIVTTNYDDAFEKASDNKIIPTNYTSSFNVSLLNRSDEPYILKLHGSYTEPDKCILFQKITINFTQENKQLFKN